MEIRKFVAPLLAALLLAGVAGGIWFSNTSVTGERNAQEAARIEQAR